MSTPHHDDHYAENASIIAELLQAQRYTDAAERLVEIKLQSHSPDDYWELEVLCLIKLGRLHDARDVVCRVLAKNPETQKAQEYYDQLIKLLVESGRTCVIVGEDGFDFCVLFNLVLFYVEMGFRVFISRSVVPADLIVIKRFTESTQLNFAGVDPRTPIHIYPYQGVHPQKLCERISHNPVSIFAPSPQLQILSARYFRHVGPPPVSTAFWSCVDREREYNFTHIGNFKNNSTTNDIGTWRDQDLLIEALRRNDAHVWGSGWEKVSGIQNRNAAVPILAVPPLYVKTRYALGLMYPFQLRMGTFSSRSWQAPLCGAALLCEVGSPQFPGVFPVGLDSLESKVSTLAPQAKQIQAEAVAYWTLRWTELREAVTTSLYYAPPLETGAVLQGMCAQGNTFSRLRSGMIDESSLFC